MSGKVKKVMIRLFVLLAVGLTGCDSGGSPAPPTTATGMFVDAPVEGLKYASGGQSGFTGANGEFTYEVGQPVKFSVGGVVIGEAPGAGYITPLDLVKSANLGTEVTTNTPNVIQIVQFLLTASSLTTNGIKIDQTVTTACASQTINLATASASSFNQVINQIAQTAGNRTVTSAVAAQNHITVSMAGLLTAGTFVLPPITSTGGYVPTNTTPVGDFGPPVTDNGDGTVTFSGRIWLKDANCFGAMSFEDARRAVDNLASGNCGLNDKSAAGDWQLPRVTQLINIAPNISYFSNVSQDVNLRKYWCFDYTTAFFVDLTGPTVWNPKSLNNNTPLSGTYSTISPIFVWPVRDP